MGGTKHPAVSNRTSFDRPRDHQVGTRSPVRGGTDRAPIPGKVVEGEGPAQDPAAGIFATWFLLPLWSL